MFIMVWCVLHLRSMLSPSLACYDCSFSKATDRMAGWLKKGGMKQDRERQGAWASEES